MNSSPSLIRVAVIEDHQPTRELLASWFESAAGFTCVAMCGDVETGLERLPSSPPEVILLDVNLPGMSGVEGAPRFKQLIPGVQIVMLTVYEDSEHVFAALAAGATGYMLKETPREELLTAIREVHAGGSPMSSHIARKVVQHFQTRAPRPAADSTLSARELEVLQLLAQGYLYKEIADQTHLSLHTVSTYIRRVYEKLHVRTRTEAVSWYLCQGREATRE
ncbi:MAG: response regulator transcription factor [Verrucomicrobiaceae bacterium]|nr:MAG: response regulator transcription factor [Verrucomicrobiaceae bacterium]